MQLTSTSTSKENLKMKVSDLFPSDYLRAKDDISSLPAILTVTDASVENMKDGQKAVLAFQEIKQRLVCNKTRAFEMAIVAGTEEISLWGGHRVSLFVGQSDFGPTIHIKSPRMEAAAPRPLPLNKPKEDEIPF
jgi:hypothetical protein